MRFVCLLLMVLAFAISPCLCGCEGGGGGDPADVESIGDPGADEGAPANVQPDPDDV